MPFWFKAHGFAIQIDLRTLGEDINLIKSIQDINALGKDAMLFPQYDIIVFEFLQGILSQIARFRATDKVRHRDPAGRKPLSQGSCSTTNESEHPFFKNGL
jgi:hypothetical protein